MPAAPEVGQQLSLPRDGFGRGQPPEVPSRGEPAVARRLLDWSCRNELPGLEKGGALWGGHDSA